jgi:pimeloyl-ACP methyl ester carboxylesterase
METAGSSAEADRTELARVGRMMIAYERFGDPADPALLLVMGLGMQMLAWDEEFCELLVAEGFHVVRFDNRDVGLSSKIGGKRVNLTAGLVGMTGSAAYTLDDMDSDTVGLLDELEIDRAHLVGASMGAMISQQVAGRHPERVLSLTSIMAGTGRRSLGTIPRPDILRLLLREPASTREAFIDQTVEMFGRIGSPGYPGDEARLRDRIGRSYDRSFEPEGTARQLMAILASGNRRRELARITAPTLVIHGADDRLVPAAAGRDVASTIPGARLELIEGMGHDLPPELWPQFVSLIAEHAGAAASGEAVPASS